MKILDKNRIAGIVLAAIGLIDSIYLTIIKYSENKALCLEGIGDCWSVNNSGYSEVFGIPVSLIGIVGYLAILMILLMMPSSSVLQLWGPYVYFGGTLLGTIYSIYLTYLEIAVINAICPFCVISAVVMIVLFVLSIYRMVNMRATP